MKIKWSVVASVMSSFLLFSDGQSAMAVPSFDVSSGKNDCAIGAHFNLQGKNHKHTVEAYTGSIDLNGLSTTGISTAQISAKSGFAAFDPFAVVFDDSLVELPSEAEVYMYDSVSGRSKRYRR